MGWRRWIFAALCFGILVVTSIPAAEAFYIDPKKKTMEVTGKVQSRVTLRMQDSQNPFLVRKSIIFIGHWEYQIIVCCAIITIRITSIITVVTSFLRNYSGRRIHLLPGLPGSFNQGKSLRLFPPEFTIYTIQPDLRPVAISFSVIGNQVGI